MFIKPFCFAERFVSELWPFAVLRVVSELWLLCVCAGLPTVPSSPASLGSSSPRPHIGSLSTLTWQEVPLLHRSHCPLSRSPHSWPYSPACSTQHNYNTLQDALWSAQETQYRGSSCTGETSLAPIVCGKCVSG